MDLEHPTRRVALSGALTLVANLVVSQVAQPSAAAAAPRSRSAPSRRAPRPRAPKKPVVSKKPVPVRKPAAKPAPVKKPAATPAAAAPGPSAASPTWPSAAAPLSGPAPVPATEPRTAAAPRPAARPSPSPLPTDEAFGLHLLRRTTYGHTLSLLARRESVGTQQWLEEQLHPETLDDTACDNVLQRFPLYFRDPPSLNAEFSKGTYDAMTSTARATLARACFSERQLLEVMVEFWSNHLNVFSPTVEVWSSKAWDDRNVIRAHALGRFSDMLLASARSPAMLKFLDNASSRGAAPNENYGRELLELHTLGRDGGYTQDDVRACALALTGLSVWRPSDNGPADAVGMFRYRPDRHYVGPLRLLDWSHPNSGATAGPEVAESLLRYLAVHPATAAHLARKLCLRFVSDDPPARLVEHLAAVYLASDTSVVPVLRALFASPEFAGAVGQKYRRPYEDVVATVRVLELQPSQEPLTETFVQLVSQLSALGQAPSGWQAPDGYPDTAAAWTSVGSTLQRWNLHMGLVGGWWKNGGLLYPGASTFDRLLSALRPATREALVDATAARLLPGEALPPAHRHALVAFLGGPGPMRVADTSGIFDVLVALLLDSPHWSRR